MLQTLLLLVICVAAAWLLCARYRRKNSGNDGTNVDGGGGGSRGVGGAPIPLLPERRTLLGGHYGWVKEQIQQHGGLGFAAHVVAGRRHRLPVFALMFGPVGFARRACVVTDAKLAQQLLSEEAATVVGTSEQIADAMQFLVGKSAMFAVSDVAQWKRYSRLLKYVFVRRLRDFAVMTTWNVCQDHLGKLCGTCTDGGEEMEQDGRRGSTLQRVDVKTTIGVVTMDAMTQVCLDLRVPYEEKVDGSRVDIGTALTELAGYCDTLAFKPSLSLWKVLNPRESRRCQAHHDVIAQAVAKRLKEKSSAATTTTTASTKKNSAAKEKQPAGDLLTLLAEAEDDGYDKDYIDGDREENDAGAGRRGQQQLRRLHGPVREVVTFRGDEIVDQALMMFLVGYKTISTSFAWLLYHLAKHGYVQFLCRKEINRVLGDGNSSISSAPTVEQLSEMVFCRWVIMESMRLCPAAPLIARTMKQDSTIGGYEFKKGDSVLVSSYLIQRSDDWEAPETFSAARWNSPEGANLGDTSFLAFGAGRRKCPAEDVSLLQLQAMLVSWLRRFQLFLAEEKVDEVVTFTYEPRRLLLHLAPVEQLS